MPNITNPEAFQLEAAAILAAGYEHFPMPFGWELDPDTDVYPTETGQSRAQIQMSTILWLRSNGYLAPKGSGAGFINNRGLGQWYNLELTQIALSVLNSVPDVLQGKDPLGKRLVDAVKSGGATCIKSLLPVAIKMVLDASTQQ